MVEARRDLVYQYDYIGQTCVHLSISRNHPDVLQYLLSKSAPTEIADYKKTRPLTLALAQNRLRCIKVSPENLSQKNKAKFKFGVFDDFMKTRRV